VNKQLASGGSAVKVEQEMRQLDLVLWESAEAEVEYPSGAAAAMAIVAFVAFLMGLAVAAVLLL
jgi:hypothetical protein